MAGILFVYFSLSARVAADSNIYDHQVFILSADDVAGAKQLNYNKQIVNKGYNASLQTNESDNLWPYNGFCNKFEICIQFCTYGEISNCKR